MREASFVHDPLARPRPRGSSGATAVDLLRGNLDRPAVVDKEKSDSWLAGALRFALVVLFIYLVRGILLPIALGGIFALVVSPLQKRLAKRLGPKRAHHASTIVAVAAVFVVILPVTLVTIAAVSSISDLMSKDWTSILSAAETTLARILESVGQYLHIDAERLRNELNDALRTLAGAITAFVGSFAGSLPDGVVGVFLFAVSFYYFLRDGKALAAWLMKVLPFEPDETAELFTSIHATVHGAILGTMVSATTQGILIFAATSLLGVPGSVLLGVSSFLLAFVPMMGTIPVSVGSTIYLFAAGYTWQGVVMAIVSVIIGNVDNVILPWVQSASGKMHPLLALLGIFGGLSAFGPAGIFIGPVIAATTIWTVDTYADMRTRQKKKVVLVPG